MTDFTPEFLANALAQQKINVEQHAKLTASRFNIESDVEQREIELKSLKSKELDYERRHLLGQISDSELAEFNSKVEATEKALAAARRKLQGLPSAIDHVIQEISKANSKIQSGRFHLCNSIKDEIAGELNADKKIKKKLLESYAAMVNGGAHSTNWAAFLASIFPQPDQQDINESIQKFKADHKHFW